MVSAVLQTTTGGARAVARCDELAAAPYSADADGLFRAFLTPAHDAALRRLAEWMEEAGMSVRRDPAANLIGRYEGAAPGAPALIIGSHIDSVRDAGCYDGPLGIALGIECVAALAQAGERLPFAIEVVAFGDEEGSRFPAAMLTSRALAGCAPADALRVRDADGVSVGEALAGFGCDPARFAEAARDRATVLAYLEAHIEQGPVLEAEDRPIGIVTGIAAQLRYAVSVSGAAAHAGTAAMALRRDALAAAAHCLCAIEGIARDGPADLVATVGRIEALPGAANVVPGAARFSLDIRAGEAATRDAAAAAIRAAIEAICAERAVAVSIDLLHDLPASPCDPALTDLLAAAVAACGLEPRRLVSGAGHDAMVMARLCPTAMLFVRCAGGISHNPAESVRSDDAEQALQAMLGFLRLLTERGRP